MGLHFLSSLLRIKAQVYPKYSTIKMCIHIFFFPKINLQLLIPFLACQVGLGLQQPCLFPVMPALEGSWKISQNHRMAWVEKDHNDHRVSTPRLCANHQRIANHQSRLPRATSSLALDAPSLDAFTTYLGNLFQCITTLWVKNFLLISNLNLLCPSLKPFPLVLSLSTLVNSHSHFCLYALLQVLEGHNEVSPEPSLL